MTFVTFELLSIFPSPTLKQSQAYLNPTATAYCQGTGGKWLPAA